MSGDGGARAALAVHDLQLVVGEVPDLLARTGDALDAYLLAAGASQALRDVLEGDLPLVRRAAAVTPGPRPLRRMARAGAARLARGSARLSDLGGVRRALLATAEGLDRHVDALAHAVVTEAPACGVDELVALLRGPDVAAVATSPVLLASSFCSFDLRPQDLVELAERAAARWPVRTVVLGVRTSGSHLAPLLAAALRARVPGATWATVRPGCAPGVDVHEALRGGAASAARLLVVDDPPTSGASLAAGIALGRAVGFPRDAIAAAVPLLEDGGVPARLAGTPLVTLDWPAWDVHRCLGPGAVRRVVAAHAGVAEERVALSDLELPPRPHAAAHARRGYRASVDGAVPVELVAEGVGLGYLGRTVLAIAEPLGEQLPEVLGLADGVLVRRWLAEDARVTLDTPARVRAAVRYVASRHAALPAVADRATALAGRQPVWEVASRLLAAPYRELGLTLRAAGLDGAVRTLLAPAAPSVVDGQTGPGAWFEDDGGLRKVAFAERSFSHLDLASYDATYDLAGVLTATRGAGLGALAVAHFERLTGEPVDPERLLLGRLVHLWDRQRLGDLAPDVAERAMASAWRDWARERLLDGPCDVGDGAWCVLDVDGVLECDRLGAATVTPASASALRALARHGLRPLLATGRPFAEVQDRCEGYGLLGGVAEYGGVAYARGAELLVELLDDADVEAIAAVRDRLAGHPDVLLAKGCRTMVRAYRADPSGRRRALDPRLVDAVRHASRGRVRAVQGRAQTDFVAFGVDKGVGVRALLALLGARDAVPWLAVGDADADLPMLRLAALARVPANARALARGTVEATPRAYQRGLLDAVDEAVGHRGGACTACGTPPPLAEGPALLAALLAGLEGGRSVGTAAAPAILAHARAVRRASPTRPAAPAHGASGVRAYDRRAAAASGRTVPSGGTRAAAPPARRAPGRARRRGRPSA